MSDVKNETITHYLRMREWVLTRNKPEKVNRQLMLKRMGEWWFSESCAYCNIYSPIGTMGCKKCPLSDSNLECCGDYWMLMNNSENWEEWLKAWEQVVYYICVFG
jgi:hypothetical protein